jgi:hypothetical protein
MLCTFALTSAAVVIALAPGLSQAQQAPCDAREKFLSKLGKDFTEHPVSLGLASNGTVLEVLASESGSWTIIFTKPDGAPCIMATGQAWETAAPKDGRPAAGPSVDTAADTVTAMLNTALAAAIVPAPSFEFDIMTTPPKQIINQPHRDDPTEAS